MIDKAYGNGYAFAPMDAKEAAEFLRVTHNTMLGLLRRGIVPGVKSDKSRRISREALDDFLAEPLRRKQSGDPRP